jgi:hypothetical protein
MISLKTKKKNTTSKRRFDSREIMIFATVGYYKVIYSGRFSFLAFGISTI